MDIISHNHYGAVQKPLDFADSADCGGLVLIARRVGQNVMGVEAVVDLPDEVTMTIIWILMGKFVGQLHTYKKPFVASRCRFYGHWLPGSFFKVFLSKPLLNYFLRSYHY